MGGPQDVWQDTEHPWLKAEKTAIRRFIADLQRPFLGICLGHQLMADALGGRVAPARQPEVGIMEISKTEEGRGDRVLAALDDVSPVLQWHGAEVVVAPPGSVILAASDKCPIQALRFGTHAYSFQFHLEITDRTVADWAAIPTYAAALQAALGPGAVTQLRRDVDGMLARFNADARQVFDAFLRMVRDQTQRSAQRG